MEQLTLQAVYNASRQADEFVKEYLVTHEKVRIWSQCGHFPHRIVMHGFVLCVLRAGGGTHSRVARVGAVEGEGVSPHARELLPPHQWVPRLPCGEQNYLVQSPLLYLAQPLN